MNSPSTWEPGSTVTASTLKEEIREEVLIQALPWKTSAYPAIATALAAAAEVIKEHGLDVDENYAGHRGLL